MFKGKGRSLKVVRNRLIAEGYARHRFPTFRLVRENVELAAARRAVDRTPPIESRLRARA
jgi:hypothetical protein